MDQLTWDNFPLPLIQVNPPQLETYIDTIQLAYQNGIFSNSGELHSKCSHMLAKHTYESFDGYLTSSNTAGLVACLISLNVRGRHVVISNFTFAATVHAVIMAGAKPVLCDVNNETLEMDYGSLSRILNLNIYDIAAVIPTRVFGYVNDFSAIIEKCDDFGVPVVVDAAASFPAVRNTWDFGKHAKFEVFSLHATKVFGIGEGGLIVGDADSIIMVKERSNFGLDRGGSLNYVDGLNAKADEFTAARALARFPEYSKDVASRQDFVNLYKSIFNGRDKVRIIKDNQSTIYSYFPIIFSSECELLKFREIISPYLITRRYYFPTVASGYRGSMDLSIGDNLEVSESIAMRILCLPVYVKYDEKLLLNLANLLESALKEMK